MSRKRRPSCLGINVLNTYVSDASLNCEKRNSYRQAARLIE